MIFSSFFSSPRIKILIGTLLFFSFLFFPIEVSAQTNKTLTRVPISVTLDGKKVSGISAYRGTASEWFMSIKDIAKVYNAAFEWKPISSIVTMVINNKRMDFNPNDNTVLFGRNPKEMRVSSKLISDNVYIPIEALLTKEFAQLSLINSRWNPANMSLSLSYQPNITSVKYFTKPNETQVVIEMAETLPYTITRSNNTIVLRIMRGKIVNKTIQTTNGAISNIVSANDGKAAVIKINLNQIPKSIKAVQSTTLPDKITITIVHSIPVSVEEIKKDSNNSVSPEDLNDETGISPIEEGIDNSDLDKVPVENFNSASIQDESFSIVDDISSFKDIAAAVTGNKNKDAKVIIIDAGHGGTDPGAIGPAGTKEKDITLEIAYELKKLFDKNKDYIAILTRKDDVFIPLAERTHIANEKRANLFISIHCNANLNRKVGGFEVFFLSERASDAEALATERLENSVIELEGKPNAKLANIQKMLWSMMQNEYLNESSELSSFIDAGAPGKLRIQNRGVKQAGFYVLRGTQMPAVLVETAFISNYAEEVKLRTRSFQKAAAQSIYEGVLKYYERKNKQTKKK